MNIFIIQLEKGRECLSEYARVRRECVFSQDELILKMIAQFDELNYDLKLFIISEVKKMHERETRLREAVTDCRYSSLVIALILA